MQIFGNLEQVFADLYPYRWPIAALFVLALAGAVWLAYHLGWHRVVSRRPIATAIVVLPLLAIAIPIGYYLLSPLWTRSHLEEASPLVLAAVASTPVAVATSLPPAQPDVAPTATPGVTVTPYLAPGTATPTAAAPEAEPAVKPTATPESSSAVVPEPPPTQEPAPEPTVEPIVEPVVEPKPTADPEPVVEPEPTAFVPLVVRSGEFYGADDFHFGSGSALIIETEPGVFVFRVENFTVQNGPDLFIYLSTNPSGWSEDAINLGELKATDGAFNYDIPAGTDISVFQSAIVWCREFAVLFSTAPLA